MGNHEFCEECHENDFHHGRPCDPVRVAVVKADKEFFAKIKATHHNDIKTKLDSLQIKYHYDGDCFTLY